MRFRGTLMLLLLTLVCVIEAQAQNSKPKPAHPVEAVGPSRIIDTRFRRVVTVKLHSGDSLECNFLGGDEDSIEVEVAGERREIGLDTVASITFETASPIYKQQSTTMQRGAPLLVTSRLCESSGRFTFLKGEVVNTTSRRINNLTAIGTFRSRSGAIIDIEEKLIGDVLPGATGVFNVISWNDSRIQSCSVSFRIFRLGPVRHTEAIRE